MRTTIIPVLVGTFGVIGKCSDRFIEGIPDSTSLQEIQKLVFTCTAHTWKALSM